MKSFFLVCLGSAVGGGLRYIVALLSQRLFTIAFPLGTFVVNILGCLIIGFLSAKSTNEWLNPQTKLLLTTGFCGGFTTFSTFMNESYGLANDDHTITLALYIVASLALGFVAVVAGHWLGAMSNE